jgi:adenine-specific DNA-methyltransferase
MIQRVLLFDDPIPPADVGLDHPINMSAKQLGAYYTGSQVADRLVEWGLRSPSDTVLDPSFGGGVFLRAAAKRILELGGSPRQSIHGVEIDAAVHHEVGSRVQQEFGIEPSCLIRNDFFALAPESLQLDCVLGNPPFIRFHRFAGTSRELALARAAESGVKLSSLTSSWTPFLIHAMSMLKPGGRLAMVVPAELTYAAYARPFLRHLQARFGSVIILSFRQRLFLDLSEDTYLLLADRFGESNSEFRLEDFNHVGELSISETSTQGSSIRQDLDVNSIANGSRRLVEHYVTPNAKALYENLKTCPNVRPLGIHADVGIGYVSGANGFFHMTAEVAHTSDVPEIYLRRAILRGKAMEGTRFTSDDWERASRRGDSGYLLAITPDHLSLPEVVRKRLKRGEESGVSGGFKCRNRTPWYSVPHVYVPDAMLTYMSGRVPKLVANEAGAVAPNTLHILRMHDKDPAKLASLLIGWHTSLARLSMEIEGHAMGGGMLKVEPSEAERVRVPTFPLTWQIDALAEIDRMLRLGLDRQVREFADDLVLKKGLGLSDADCSMLAVASEELVRRRVSKGV